MEAIKTEKKFRFLEDGGEMGRLTCSHNWSATPVGPIELWPQSLRSIVSTVLHSGFPMLLWWGDEMIQFYNDAHRPSLGHKHPKALAQPAQECWQEMWATIHPLIKQVTSTGKSVYLEDHFLPIFRNGNVDGVYWTFSYSAVFDEAEQIKGVLVTCIEMTEKVLNLKAIRESKDQLQFAIEAAELGTWDYDPQSNKFSGNARFKVWYGLPLKSDIPLELVLQVIDEKDRLRVITAMQTALEFSSGGNYDIEYTINCVGEVRRVVRAKGRVWFNEEQQPYRFSGTLQDITAGVVAKKQIAERETQFQLLVEAAPLAIGLFVGNKKIVQMANRTFLELAGKGPEIIGRPLAESIPELKGQPFFKIQDEVFETGKKFEAFGREVYLKVNGELKLGYYNLSYTPLFDGDGKVYAILDIAMDVTEQVLVSKRLEQSEENLRNIIRQSPVAMGILMGVDLVVEIANDNLLELWGKYRAEIIGKPLLEGLPEVKGKGFDTLLSNVMTSGDRYVAHERPVELLKNGNLETKYINFVYEPFTETDGKISGVMVVAFDVTEQFFARQRIEEVVKERTESLRRTNAQLSQFASIASHDLQEPARKISTFANMLEKTLGENADDRSKSYLHKIENASNRMLKLIRDVLAISQLSKSHQKFELIDLNQTLEEIRSDFELLIEQKNCLIDSNLLPSVRGIPIQLSQLFGNLMSNALKFSTPDRPIKLTIRHYILEAAEAEKYQLHGASFYHKIEFNDNGIGFRQDYADQIFNIFQRLHNKSEYEGTGIGLATCKTIAENHGGHIFASSGEGLGATFTIILPAELNDGGQ